jgi:FG-GAP-like repeat/Phosphate-induced protein 1 conserved region
MSAASQRIERLFSSALALPMLALFACSPAPAVPEGPSPPGYYNGVNPDTKSLTYNSPGYVLEDPVNIYAIWYGNGWIGSTTPYIVEDFLNQLGYSPYYKLNELFYDFTGNRIDRGLTYIQDDWTDEGYGTNLSATQATETLDIYNVVASELNTANLPVDPNGIYIVFTSQEITESNGTGGSLCGSPSSGGYLGYHDHYPYGSIDLKYVLVGSPLAPGCAPGPWQGVTTPNGLEADTMASTAAHEIFETVQDPDINAWTNPNVQESGDICAGTVSREGVYSVGGGAVADAHIGDRDWLLQGQWVQTPFGGCDTRVDLERPNAAHAGTNGHTTQDFNHDNMADVLWQDSSTGNLSLWLMWGTSPAAKQTIAQIPNNLHFYGTGDFDDDHKTDIVLRDENTGNVQVWLMDGATHTSTLTATLNAGWQLIGIADLAGTGHDRILVRSTGSTAAILGIIPGGGSHNLVNTDGSNAIPPWNMQLAGTGDFDGDGKSDLLWRDASSRNVLIWYMNGSTVEQTFSTGITAQLVRGIGDIDGDGHADLVYSPTSATPGLYSTQLDVAYFKSRGTYGGDNAFGSLPNSQWRVEQISDANADGRAEIYVRNRQTGEFGMWWITSGTPHLNNYVSIDTPRLDEEVQRD